MDITGLILEAQAPQYQVLLKGPLHKVWRDGFPVDEQKILQLQFDRYICFVDDMQRRQEWTDEDRTFVERGIEQLLDDPSFREMWVHVPVRPPAPWPTYDETHHKQIHVVAASVGLIEQALAYELHGREDGPRPEVVKNLEAAKSKQPEGVPEGEEIYAA